MRLAIKKPDEIYFKKERDGMSIRGEPKYPKRICHDLSRSIFERTFYFCKLSNISIKEYIEILKEECKKRGIENDFLL